MLITWKFLGLREAEPSRLKTGKDSGLQGNFAPLRPGSQKMACTQLQNLRDANYCCSIPIGSPGLKLKREEVLLRSTLRYENQEQEFNGVSSFNFGKAKGDIVK